MWRYHVSVSVTPWVALLCGLCMGCTDPGLPWGVIEANLEVRFDPADGRLDDEGRLKTSANYTVSLDNLEMSFDAITVVLGGAGVADFDPANPPAGYSLCHNGHCHSDSGELVDCEKIALEMTGSTGGARVSVGLDGSSWALDEDPVEVGVMPCEPAPCALPRGELVAVELNFGSLHIAGTVYDQLTGESARLSAEGWAFEVTVPLMAPVTALLEGTIGLGEPVGLVVNLDFDLPSALFDDVDFGIDPPVDTAMWEAVLSGALEDHGVLEVTSQRFDF